MLGCGGGDDDGANAAGTGDDGAISKSAFLKEGNAICLDAKKEIEAELHSGKGNLVSATGVGLQTEYDEIAALSAPTGDEAKVKAILEATRKTIAEIKTGNIGKATTQLEAAEKLAGEYGLTACLVN